MSLFTKLLGRKSKSLLSVAVDGKDVLSIDEKELPIEARLAFPVTASSEIEFVEESGRTHTHALLGEAGFFHLSLRVYPNFAVQADGLLSGSKALPENALERGEARGLRFQPFFIQKKGQKPPDLKGKGLFARGLHYNGVVTPSKIVLSAICDECEKAFQFTSFHSGFSDVAYFYSSSGKHTLAVSLQEPGAPSALTKPDDEALQLLERKLPSAPDASKYSYLNPFRCPHCRAAYIDFENYPEIRSSEYYANVHVGQRLQQF